MSNSSAMPKGVEVSDLKRKSVRGAAINIASQGVSLAIQLTSSAVLARMLLPSEYGIVAMVLALTSFAGLFRDFGLSSAAIQKGNLTHIQQSSLFWLNIGFGTLLTLAVIASAPLVVWFYEKPELYYLTITVAFNFVVNSIGTQHGALLVRNMQFGRQAIASISGSCVSLIFSIVLAHFGYSYWALVLGSLSGAVVTTIVLMVLSPFRPTWYRRDAGIGYMLRFGANITAFDFVNYFQRNLDNILIGRFWGPGELGMYSRAYSLLMLPITSIRGPINAVAFPALSRLQGQPVQYRDYFLRTTFLIALLSMPLAGYMAVASKQIILLLLGPAWVGVAPIFFYLSLAALVQPTSGFAGSLLLSLGFGRRYLLCGMFNATVLSISIVAGLKWGAIGVAISYAIGNYLILIPWLLWAFRNSPVTLPMFASSCKFPLLVTASAAVCAFTARGVISEMPPFYSLCGLSAAFLIGALPPFIFCAKGQETFRFISKNLRESLTRMRFSS